MDRVPPIRAEQFAGAGRQALVEQHSNHATMLAYWISSSTEAAA
jgi:hypothetical protein